MWGELPRVDVVVFKVNMFQMGIFILLLTVLMLILVVGPGPADAFWGHCPVTREESCYNYPQITLNFIIYFRAALYLDI